MSSPLEFFWHQAVDSPLGVRIRTPNPIRLKTLLYNERRRMNVPLLAHFHIRTSPIRPKDEIWIVRAMEGNPYAG